MKIDYQRDLNKSYMIIRELVGESSFDDKVLSLNKIATLLPVQRFYQDGEKEYWYEVTGKQSLDICQSVCVLEEDGIRNLILQFCQTIEQVEKYLLEPQNIRFMPETLFIDLSQKKYYFCYCPGEGEALTTQFRHLVEYLLTKVDHKQEGTVRMVYGLYEMTQQEVFTMSDIRQAIIPKQMEHSIERTPEAVMVSENKLETIRRNDVNIEGQSREHLQTEENQQDHTHKAVLLRQKIEKEIQHFFKPVHEKRTTIQEIKRRNITIPSFLTPKKEEIPQFVFEPEEEIVPVSHPTVLLAEQRTQIQGRFIYIGTGNQKDLWIDKTPFLIGSEKGRVDGCIESKAVSRSHARILKEGEVFLIEDLNSTNGTAVGGACLNYKVRMSLQPNDCVKFADEEYRFC